MLVSSRPLIIATGLLAGCMVAAPSSTSKLEVPQWVPNSSIKADAMQIKASSVSFVILEFFESTSRVAGRSKTVRLRLSSRAQIFALLTALRNSVHQSNVKEPMDYEGIAAPDMIRFETSGDSYDGMIYRVWPPDVEKQYGPGFANLYYQYLHRAFPHATHAQMERIHSP